MYVMNVIKEQLYRIINDIDAGNSNLTEEEALSAMKMLQKFSKKDKPMSKVESYKYLGISRSKFDSLIRDNLLPIGKKQVGFKELFWFKKDLDKYISNNYDKQ